MAARCLRFFWVCVSGLFWVCDRAREDADDFRLLRFDRRCLTADVEWCFVEGRALGVLDNLCFGLGVGLGVGAGASELILAGLPTA